MLKVSQAQAYIDRVKQRPESARPPKGILRHVQLQHRKLEVTETSTWDLFDLTPSGVAEDAAAFVYLHGGAYVGQIGQEAWYFAARLAALTHRKVTVALYPLIPFITAVDLVPQTRAVFANEIERNRSIIAIGDSAGGGLALAAAVAARDAGEQLPNGLVLISPWTDVSLSHPDVAARERRDVMLAPAGLRHFGTIYRGELEADDWRASPLFADLSGLPPTLIFAAEDDVLYSDATRLAERLSAIDGPNELYIGTRMLHVWPLANIPEGQTAIDEIVRFCGTL